MYISDSFSVSCKVTASYSVLSPSQMAKTYLQVNIEQFKFKVRETQNMAVYRFSECTYQHTQMVSCMMQLKPFWRNPHWASSLNEEQHTHKFATYNYWRLSKQLCTWTSTSSIPVTEIFKSNMISVFWKYTSFNFGSRIKATVFFYNCLISRKVIGSYLSSIRVLLLNNWECGRYGKISNWGITVLTKW